MKHVKANRRAPGSRIQTFVIVIASCALSVLTASRVYAPMGGQALTAHEMALPVGSKMQMSETAPPESLTAQAALPSSANTPLPRFGWTVSASDEQSTNPASNVLDGDAGSFWISPYSPIATPLPHSLTIDMKSGKLASGLTYLPREDGSANGNIGQYTVRVSNDGLAWSAPVAQGSWADSRTQKTVTFPAVTTRYIQLTALTEAGARGPWAAASEVNVLTQAQNSPAHGAWGPQIKFPLVPVSAVVLPNNRLLTFSAYAPISWNKASTVTLVSILDLRTGIAGPATTVSNGHQMFCVGMAILADGRVLVNGGSSDSATSLYSPTTDSWVVGPPMNIPRGYEGDTLLSTGQVFTLGGSWYDSGGGKNGELFTPSGATGTWAKLPNVVATTILTADPKGFYRADNHAWLFATSDGGVFHAGPSRTMHWITTAGLGSITSAGPRGTSADAMNGNAVMYDIGKLLTLGGAPAYDSSQSTNEAYTVDIRGGPTQPAVVARTSDMAYQRAFSNSVVLPDGDVLVVGGQQFAKTFTNTGAATVPELWDPATGTFTLMATDVIPRTYHSVAVLLPDATVFSGGGGLCGKCSSNHLDGRIFTPPYLLNSDGSTRSRPVITAAPAGAAPGSSITVTTDAAVSKFALVRTSAVTHSVNNDQRRIPIIPSSVSGTTYTLPLPADTGVLLPGTYMLFALNASGTPSISKFIQVN